MNKEIPAIDPVQTLEAVQGRKAKKEAKTKSQKELAADRLAKRIVKKLSKKGQIDIPVKAGKFGILDKPEDEDVYLNAGKKISDSGTDIEFVVHRLLGGNDGDGPDTIKVLKVGGKEVRKDSSDEYKKARGIKIAAVYPPKSSEDQ